MTRRLTATGTRMEQVITAVRPGIAARGQRHAIQIELTPANAQRQQVPAGTPSWGQIGPFEALTISRDGDLVTLEVEIPADASVGVWLDCHLEFEPAGGNGPLVYKKNDAFRVSE